MSLKKTSKVKQSKLEPEIDIEFDDEPSSPVPKPAKKTTLVKKTLIAKKTPNQAVQQPDQPNRQQAIQQPDQPNRQQAIQQAVAQTDRQPDQSNRQQAIQQPDQSNRQQAIHQPDRQTNQQPDQQPNQEQDSVEPDVEPDEPDEPPKPAKKTIKKVVKKPVKKPIAVKKGPGRPRKVPKKDPIERKGIMSTPTGEDSVVEFLYDSPMYLRKAILFFKSLAAANIQMLFLPDRLVMYAPDHYNKTLICVTFFTSKINKYYCKHPLNIGASTKDLEAITASIDKDYSSVILLLTDGSAQKNLTMILENDIHIDETHTIDLIAQYDQLTNEFEFLDENYTIQFEWPSKYFRKTIGDIKSISKTLSIVQVSESSPLEIQYISSNKKIHSTHIVRNPERIKLVSTLANDESFRVGVSIDYIKPISSAHIADEIVILVDEKKRLMTKAYIDDGTIEIKTLTEIIDDRPN